MTSIVATPRRIHCESHVTTGAIVMAANQAMSTVKMTFPPSWRTNLRNSPSAMTPSTTSPTRHTFEGSNRTVFVRSKSDMTPRVCRDVCPFGDPTPLPPG